MKSPTYTPEQWAEIQPALRSFSLGTVEMAKLVLVDGKRIADVAREFEHSRQHVGQSVKRVRAILEANKEDGAVPTLIWLPQNIAELLKTLDQQQIADAILQAAKAS